MRPEDFAAAAPQLRIEDYFLGRTRAWGLFEDRFGTVRRQFRVEIEGTLDHGELVLDERFLYDDGDTERRIWRIRRIDDRRYEGRADDVIGVARGTAFGNALNWTYRFDLKVGARRFAVRFDDWMFLQQDGVLINRATVAKLGIGIGRVSLFFLKPADS